jgi:hypothetical protein
VNSQPFLCHPVTRWVSPVERQAHLLRRQARVGVPAGRARPGPLCLLHKGCRAGIFTGRVLRDAPLCAGSGRVPLKDHVPLEVPRAGQVRTGCPYDPRAVPDRKSDPADAYPRAFPDMSASWLPIGNGCPLRSTSSRHMAICPDAPWPSREATSVTSCPSARACGCGDRRRNTVAAGAVGSLISNGDIVLHAVGRAVPR